MMKAAATAPPVERAMAAGGSTEVREGRRSRAMREAALVAGALLAACGGGPQLSNLRCRTNPCQSPEQPFTLRLAVDFSDDTATLAKGALELRVDGTTQSAVSLADLFSAQHLDPKLTHGTIAVDQDVVLDRVGQNQTFASSLVAHNGQGQKSNEPTLSFNLKLGGP